MARFDLRDLFKGRTPQERVDALHLRPDLARAAVVLVADERVDGQLVRLDRLLEPDETVMMLVEGRCRRQLGLLVLSSRRVLFRPHGELSDPSAAFPLTELSAADFRTGSMTGRVRLRFATAELEVDRLLGTLAEQFVAAVRAQQEPGQQHVPGAAGTLPRDPLQELVQLRERYTAGEISATEYEARKARLVQEL